MSFKQTVKSYTFGDIPKAVEEGNQAAIAELVTRVTAQAKALAPVDLGELRASIMGRTSDGDFDHDGGAKISERPKEGEGYVGSAVLHGIYQEFGTRKMNAQPWLRPAIAIEASGAKVKEVVKKYGNDVMKKRGKRRIEVK